MWVMTRKRTSPEQKANGVDRYVGHRMNMCRIFRGMSQAALGDDLGISFQQVQKYERGSNRISASRLYDLCRIFKVPVMYFFEGYAIHGTYWHNNFGTPMSHGCVNLPTPEAEWFFRWAEMGTPVHVQV